MDQGAYNYNRYINGDDQGFEEIVKEYYQNLLFFINGYIGNITIAEDLMEDTFAEIIVNKKGFKGKSTFKTYLFSIARNKTIDYIRKNKRYENELIKEISIYDYYELEDQIVRTERQQMISSALDSLKKEYRSVLILLYFEEMKYEEIALIMKKTSKQIKNLLYSARKALKQQLEMEGFHYEEL